jgi:uncharacterized protein (UPF0332 family)
MSFDWSDYFRLAQELEHRVDEASLRSAISRAYYYVYHLALARAEANAYKPMPGEGTHTQLWRVFSGSPEPKCQRLAIIAGRMKEKRERADYGDRYARVAEDVPTLLADAREFEALLRGLPERHPNPRSMRQ